MADYKNPDSFTSAIQVLFPKLMHYLRAEENKELKGHGITPGQMNALLVLYFNDNLTMGKLSADIYMAESAATRLVNRLVELNLVQRERDENDRRVVRVALTSQGRQLARLAFHRREYRFKNLSEKLSTEEQKMLITPLKSVLRAIQDLEKERAQKIKHRRKQLR
ncbi:MAG: MarR family transcriptional regulator [Firmicutes bacterium]|nr:MarR family transcriptional regulator [Bacillota bacterium]